MFPFNLIYFLLIGLCAGWLAGYWTKGKGFGLTGNVIVGVAGALIGGFIRRMIPDAFYDLAMSTAGAILFLAVMRQVGPGLGGRGKRR